MTPTTPSPISPVKEFEALCDLIPEDAYWGMPLTPDLVRHIRDCSTAPISDQAAGEPISWKLVPIEPTEEMETAAENDYEQTGATFPDWKSAYRAMLKESPCADVNSLSGVAAKITETLLGSPSIDDHAYVLGMLKQVTAPTTGSAPVAFVCDFGTHQKLAFVPLEGANEHRALIYADAAPASPEATSDFDSWMGNPYTKVLQQSIKDDYVPKDAASPTASVITAIRDALNVAYAEGWAASGEGYNYEYPGRNFNSVNWEAKRNLAIDHLFNRIAASMGDKS